VHDTTHAKAISQYSKSIVAEVQKDNYIGCQFHPEKSSRVGHKYLKNFILKS
jgi:glutamine amidotransferase